MVSFGVRLETVELNKVSMRRLLGVMQPGRQRLHKKPISIPHSYRWAVLSCLRLNLTATQTVKSGAKSNNFMSETDDYDALQGKLCCLSCVQGPREQGFKHWRHEGKERWKRRWWMMGGWWEQQCQDSSFQEVKSVSSWFPWGCSTWERRLPAACIHKAKECWAGEPVTFDRESVRERKYIEMAKKRHPVQYFISAVQRTFLSQWGNNLGLHVEPQGWLNVKKREAKEKKWEVR